MSAGKKPCRLASFKNIFAAAKYLFLVATAKSVRSAKLLLNSKKLLRLNPRSLVKSKNKPIRYL